MPDRTPPGHEPSANKLASIRRIVELCLLDQQRASDAHHRIGLEQQALIEIATVLDS